MDWSGPPTLSPTDVEHVVFLRVCHSVESVFMQAIMRVMISTCLKVKQEEPVIVEMSV